MLLAVVTWSVRCAMEVVVCCGFFMWFCIELCHDDLVEFPLAHFPLTLSSSDRVALMRLIAWVDCDQNGWMWYGS
jgi:hypothetical protein